MGRLLIRNFPNFLWHLGPQAPSPSPPVQASHPPSPTSSSSPESGSETGDAKFILSFHVFFFTITFLFFNFCLTKLEGIIVFLMNLTPDFGRGSPNDLTCSRKRRLGSKLPMTPNVCPSAAIFPDEWHH